MELVGLVRRTSPLPVSEGPVAGRAQNLRRVKSQPDDGSAVSAEGLENVPRGDVDELQIIIHPAGDDLRGVEL